MTKVISLSNKAYQTLRGLKGEEDSFSDVVLRIAPSVQPRKKLADFFGILKDQADEWRDIKKRLYEDRKRAKMRGVRF